MHRLASRVLPLCVVLWLASSGCLNRAMPRDTAVEIGDFSTPRAAPPVVETRPSIRVVTFNVHGETRAAIVSGLQKSRDLARADIILLQEIEAHGHEPESRPRQIARDLGMAFAYAPGYGLPGGGSHGVAILSRYPLSEVALIELPRNSVHFNSARRVALGATVHVGRSAVRVYSVHLDNRINPAERRAQLRPVLERAAGYRDTPVIVGGDLNTSPFCWIGHVLPIPCGLQARRLERMARRLGFDTPVTGSGGTSKWLAMRLDGLYTRGLAVARFSVDDSVRLSDHLPLWMDVVIAE